MHVVVVGCGRVGAGLAGELCAAGHSVAIVDRSPRAFRRLPPTYTGARVLGSGFDRDDLERAGAVGADALAAVTSGDNTNVLAARIARESYQIPNVVARIYDPRRAEIYQRLGIPTVATVTWTIDQVLRRLVPTGTAGEWADASGKLSIVDRVLPEQWAGRPLAELGVPGRLRVIAVTRAGEPRLDADQLVGQEGDLLHVALMKGERAMLEERLTGGGAAGGGEAAAGRARGPR